MKTLQQLVVILPCHTLEDFPVHHDEVNAASLLANWTAIWHPSLISQAQQIPQWVSSDFVNTAFDNALVLVPSICQENIPFEVTDAVNAGAAEMVSAKTDRASIFQDPVVSKWIAAVAGQPADELVSDFFALGYAFLQVQLMTRQLRYSSSIDMSRLNEVAVKAASAATSGNTEEAKNFLQQCFDLIAQERSSYYPTDPELIDLILVAESTLDDDLLKQLDAPLPGNWLLSGILFQEIQDRPAAIEKLKTRVQNGSAAIVGGQQLELPSALVSIEAINHQLATGLKLFESQEITIETFATRSFGVGPYLPQVLTQFGFESTIHAAFSGGDIPTNCAPVMNWQGLDGTNVPALAMNPLDAGSARSFLGFGIKIGEILDSHHHCPVLLVHWPDRTSEYFQDLLRVLRYAPIFGEFVTVNRLNESIYDNGFSESHESDHYRFPWLKTLIQTNQINPISRYCHYWKTHYEIQAMMTWCSVLSTLEKTSRYSQQIDELDALQSSNERALIDGSFDDNVARQIRSFQDQFDEFSFIGKNVGENSAIDPASTLVNPSSAHRTLAIEDQAGEPDIREVPPFSFRPLSKIDRTIRSNAPDLIFEDPDSGLPVLRNDFFEVRFDATTGGVRSVNRHGKRGNLFSQLLGMRRSSTEHQHGFPRQRYWYVEPQLEKCEIVQQNKCLATVRTWVKLVEETDGNEVARASQSVTISRLSRHLDFQVNIESIEDLSGPVWNNYFGSRLAFPNRDLTWHRGDQEFRVSLNQEKVVAPQYVEILDPGISKVSLLSAGIPFHRKIDDRKLDSLLVVDGESSRHFEFAISIDSPTSLAAAIAYLSPTLLLPADSRYARRNGWIFSINCKNVVVTYLRPKYGEGGNANGIAVRLLETEKRSGELRIRFPFELISANRTNFRGEKLNELDFEGDCVTCNYCEHQFFQLECSW